MAGQEREVLTGFGPGLDDARVMAALRTVRHMLGLAVDNQEGPR
jgi:hypothetical protein